MIGVSIGRQIGKCGRLTEMRERVEGQVGKWIVMQAAMRSIERGGWEVGWLGQ